MNELYPMKFKPLFQEKIWGGHKISQVFEEAGSMKKCGEAWILSGVPGNQTLVSNGFLEDNELNELVEVYMGDLVGERVFEQFAEEFPILVKLIDSNAWLSVQVHPDDQLARRKHKANGKSEMWYILDAGPEAELITGFEKEVSPAEYSMHLKNRSLKEILHTEKVFRGDVFYIPAGRVHSLGPGILLAEIQQTSDITYRIYDWDRVDDKGHPRELHTEQALEALDFKVYPEYKTRYSLKENGTSPLVKSPHFTTNLIATNKSLKKDYSELDSFVIHMCIEGGYQLVQEQGSLPVTKGEAVLIPAILGTIGIIPKAATKILEIYI